MEIKENQLSTLVDMLTQYDKEWLLNHITIVGDIAYNTVTIQIDDVCEEDMNDLFED